MLLDNFTKKALLIMSLLTVFNYTAFAKQKLVIVADYWCPYNCEPRSNEEGYLVEIARYALEKEDLEVEYELRPWDQSVNDFNEGNVDGVFGANDRDLTDPVLPLIHQAEGRIAAFTLKDTSWIYDGARSLDGKNIKIVEAYAYPTDIKSYIYSHYLSNPDQFHFSNSENAVKDGIDSLIDEKVFTYIEDENVVFHYAESKNITTLRHAGSVNRTPEKIYVAFSKANPNSHIYAKSVTTAMLELKSSGKLNELKKKYNIKNYQDVAVLLK